MRAAFFCGGSSVKDAPPVRKGEFDLVIAVNHMGERIQWDEWAAHDRSRAQFQKMCPSYEKVTWDHNKLLPPWKHARPYFTFPMAMNKLLTDYEPEEIHCFGVDYRGERVDGATAASHRWSEDDPAKSEILQLVKLDLSRCVWRGLWKPTQDHIQELREFSLSAK